MPERSNDPDQQEIHLKLHHMAYTCKKKSVKVLLRQFSITERLCEDGTVEVWAWNCDVMGRWRSGLHSPPTTQLQFESYFLTVWFSLRFPRLIWQNSLINTYHICALAHTA